MTKDKKTIKEQPTGYRIYSQYILIGAAIGLYYGLFGPNTTNPDYGMAVTLAILAGIITVIVRSWKKQRTFAAIFVDFLKITAMFLIFLLALQLRAVIQRIGGKVLVVAFMTLIGMIFGLIMGMRRKPAQS